MRGGWTYVPLDGHRRIAALRRLNRETAKAVFVNPKETAHRA